VVTALGETPVHVEFYSGPEGVAQEKSKLVKALPPSGLAVLNHDDEAVFNMKDLGLAEARTYGFSEGADVRASDVSYFLEKSETVVGGISFKLSYNKSFIPFRLVGALGRHQIYAALAAAVIGLHFKMNLVEIAQALENLEFPKQRLGLLKGLRDTWIIDDSYNASPLSCHAALDTLKEFGDKVIAKNEKGRKIAVLGDMKELGIFTERAHRLIGNLAGERAQYLFTVGPAAKFIADSAFNQLPKENIMSFDSSDEAGEYLKDFVQEGDIILVKGSRAMEMEKVVEILMKV
jgi:UDP-N-acetylmuramoyl-tripeptide--D-alanyl-D-alanine ligase